MLDRGDAVVYKCRGLYKVEEIGTLDFLYSDSGSCGRFRGQGVCACG